MGSFQLDIHCLNGNYKRNFEFNLIQAEMKVITKFEMNLKMF